MGIELEGICDIQITSTLVDRVFQELAVSDQWVVLSSMGSRLVLRYSGHPSREAWPEDIELDLGDSKIYVLFHSGGASEREGFLRCLSEVLASNGVSCKLEEI